MDKMIKDGWFTESHEMWPGQAFSLEVEEVLYHQKSKFQDILVFQSKKYGRVLVLDGIIQVTERDEFAYQEMIAHLPLFSHPNPKSVLVVGGGDGGVLREVAKHPSVEEIHICEIDEEVIEVAKKYLPFMAVGYSNPKVKVHIEDGAKFLTAHQSSFDVIITDSSDPVGPNASLFQRPYFEKLRDALKPDGIICTQGECLWLDIEVIKGVSEICQSLFPVTGYGFTTIPTYPSGQIGFIMASLNKDTVFWKPPRSLSEGDTEKFNLRYYNNEIHKAAFVLPQFAKKELGLQELGLAVNPS